MSEKHYKPGVVDAASALCYMVECQMATLEHARLKKSTGKGELARFESLVEMGLEWCRTYASAEIAHKVKCPRVEKALTPPPVCNCPDYDATDDDDRACRYSVAHLPCPVHGQVYR
jgi:hypothetical protein